MKTVGGKWQKPQNTLNNSGTADRYMTPEFQPIKSIKIFMKHV